MQAVNHLSYAAAYHLVGALLLLPLLAFFNPLPNNANGWLYAGVAAFFWFIAGITGFYNIQRVEAPKIAVLKRVKIVAIALLSVVFLGEALTAARLASLALIFLATIILSVNSLKLSFDRDALLVIFTAVVSAAALVADKAALPYFQVPAYAFWMFLAPGVGILVFSKQKLSLHSNNLHGFKKFILISIVLDVSAYLLGIFVLQRTDAIVTSLLLELTVPLTVIGGIVFLHERKDLKKVILATILSIAGTILLLI